MHGEGNSSDLSLLSRIQLEDNTTDSHKQGAYRQPLFRNKVWKRDANSESPTRGSLFSRLSPDAASLIRRVSSPSPDEKHNPYSKGRRRSLIDRIAQNGDEGEEEGGSAEGQRLLKESVPETAVSREELELAEMFIASALQQREHESHENPVSPVEEPASPTSEAAVDNLLENEADIEDGSTAAMNTNERPSNTIAATLPSSDSPQSSLKPASPVDLALMEEAKRLLIPVIARNAQLRDPDADMEAIKERVMSLVTDAQCLEFVRLAREARDQMQDKSERVAADLAKSGREERGKNVQEHSVQQDLEGRSTDEIDGRSLSRHKRPREEATEHEHFEPLRPPKIPRLEHVANADTVPPPAMDQDGKSIVPNSEVRSQSPPPRPGRTTPKAPKAMLANLELYGEYIPSKPQHSDPNYGRRNSVERSQHSHTPAQSFNAISPEPTADVPVHSPLSNPIPQEPVVQQEIPQEVLPPPMDIPQSSSVELGVHGAQFESKMDTSIPDLSTPGAHEQETLDADDEGAHQIVSLDNQPAQAMHTDQMEVDSANPVPQSIDTAVQQRRSSTPSARIQNEDGQSTPARQPEDPAQSSMQLSIPGIWFVAVGRSSPDVYEIEFEVDDGAAAAAMRWARRRKAFDPKATHASVHLQCLPISEVTQTNQKLNPSATPQEVAIALWNIKTKWPPQGKLIVEFNSSLPNSGSWLPKQLGPEDGPIEITACIQPGKNTARIIQLSDASNCVFVLYAGRPSPKEMPQGIATSKWEGFLRKASAQPMITS